MSAPFFPTIEEVMTILMGEMPDGVYARDRADDPDPSKRSVSSSEIRAHADTFARLYSNLSSINSSKHLSTLDPGDAAAIRNWEKMLFTTAQDSSQPFSVRQQNLISKYRARGGLSYPYIYSIVSNVLTPLGLSFDVLAYAGCPSGAWVLDVSPLDLDTWLAEEDPLLGARRDRVALDCSLDYAAAGITPADVLSIQATAYTYEVRIYGTAPATAIKSLDDLLTQNEKGGVTHIIRNGSPTPPDGTIIDLGSASGPIGDIIDCGSGQFFTPFDPWDMNGGP